MRTFVEECHLAGLVCAQTNTHMVLQVGVGLRRYTWTKLFLMLRLGHSLSFDVDERRLWLGLDLDLKRWSRSSGGLDLV